MKEKKNLTEFMLSLVQTLEDEHRFGSAHVYRSTLHTFTAYWNKDPYLVTRLFVLLCCNYY